MSDADFLRRAGALLDGPDWRKTFHLRLGLSDGQMLDVLEGRSDASTVLTVTAALLSARERDCWLAGYDIRARLNSAH